METTIGAWGNSDAIRIPKEIMRRVNMGRGDRVSITANEKGVIEIAPLAGNHRAVSPKKGVTFDSLFRGYDATANAPASAWPDEGLVGAEWEAWAR